MTGGRWRWVGLLQSAATQVHRDSSSCQGRGGRGSCRSPTRSFYDDPAIRGTSFLLAISISGHRPLASSRLPTKIK